VGGEAGVDMVVDEAREKASAAVWGRQRVKLVKGWRQGCVNVSEYAGMWFPEMPILFLSL